MENFSHRCTGSWRAGENGFYLSPSANQVRIQYNADAKAWLYNVERTEAKAFKAWAKTAFQKNGIPARILGRFPSYDVSTAHCG